MPEQNPYRDDLESRVSNINKRLNDVTHNVNDLLHRPAAPVYRLTPGGKFALVLIPLLALSIIAAAMCGYYAWGSKPIPTIGVVAAGLIAGIPSLGIATIILVGNWGEFWKRDH